MFKVGTRVRITKNVYLEHPSRMKGGTGTVVKVGDIFYWVAVDDDPEMDSDDVYVPVWCFSARELEAI